MALHSSENSEDVSADPDSISPAVGGSYDGGASAQARGSDVDSAEVDEVEAEAGKSPERSGAEGHANTVVYACPVDHAGTTVHLKGWLVKGRSDAPPVVLVHDLGENLGIFKALASMLSKRGNSAYAFDMRGHGRSGRMLGHINNFDELVNDLLQVSSWVRFREHRRAPVVVGQGIGALVALEFAQKYPEYCSGLILAAPSLRMRFAGWPGMKLFFRTLSDLMPRIHAPRSLYPKYCQNPPGEKQTIIEALKQQMASPMLVPTVRFVHEILNVQATLEGAQIKLAMPAFALLGENDKLVDYRTFAEKWEDAHMPPLVGRPKLVSVQAQHRIFVDDAGQLNAAAVRELTDWLDALAIYQQSEEK